MSRSARVAPDGGIFHVMTRGNNRQTVFHEEADFLSYLRFLGIIQQKHLFKLFHYCLMTNHVHLLLETRAGHPLSEIMKKINLTYALYYKKKYEHVGHFWQDRFKSLLIEKDSYLAACGAYIELNPVKAGLVKRPEAHPHSSYRFYAFGDKLPLLSANPLYSGFGQTEEGRRRNYRELIDSRAAEYVPLL